MKAPEHQKEFAKRLDAQPEAARAEAVTFSWLRQQDLRPRPGEVIGQGGVDFLCTPDRKPAFAVEVTCLLTTTVSSASGLQHAAAPAVRSFSQITTKLLKEAINKAPQLADYQMPRVLVLATEHDSGALLMNAHSASELLTGSTAFRLRIGDTKAEPELIAGLRNAVFFRITKDKAGIEAARRSISAIVLMTIGAETGGVIGILHPDPVHPLDPQTFERMHFVRLATWPIKPGGRFRVEWIGPTPSPTSFANLPMRFEDRELREE